MIHAGDLLRFFSSFYNCIKNNANIFKNANLRLASQEKVKWQIKSHNFFLGFAESYAEY